MVLVKNFRELRVYQQAFKAAARIFELSKSWPKEERYSLTDQIRRSSRSICANIGEAWCKRRYPSHFVSMLSDADAEGAETRVWLDFALDCGYIAQEEHASLNATYDHIAGGLVRKMANAKDWCGPSELREAYAEYDSHTPTLPHCCVDSAKEQPC